MPQPDETTEKTVVKSITLVREEDLESTSFLHFRYEGSA